MATDVSKLNGYTIIVPLGSFVSKLNAYAIIASMGTNVSKLNAYAILQPYTPGASSSASKGASFLMGV
jgi:hypothetical protein